MNFLKTLTRRGFFAFPALAAFLPSALLAAASEPDHSGHGANGGGPGGRLPAPAGGHAGHGAGMDPAAMYPAHAWADPAIPLSPPPPLTGRRMGSVITPDVPPLGWEMDRGVKVFRLVAQPVERLFVDGDPAPASIWDKMHKAKGIMAHAFVPNPVRLWGFNGSCPGPTIEAVEGDRVRIVVKNELPEATTIHWHGLEVPNDQDGVGGLTQDPIMPGQTWIYEFTLHQNGCYLYHSSFNEKKQVGLGLGGFFVIHPKTPTRKLDKDFAIMLNEWRVEPGNPHVDVTSTDPNWFTFNGKSAPSTTILRVRQHDRVRVRFANLSNQNAHPIHLHGHTWWVVGTEGGPIQESAWWPGNTVDVPPGSAREVEFTADNPGLWHFHCHKLHHIVNAHVDMPMGVMPMGGMTTILEVVPSGQPARKPPRTPGTTSGHGEPHAGHDASTSGSQGAPGAGAAGGNVEGHGSHGDHGM